MSTQTILIIEDEPSLVEVLTYNLEKEGFEVLAANNGRDGLERARSALPDLIILDLMLPLVDGLQVCSQLRSDPTTQNIRVLKPTTTSPNHSKSDRSSTGSKPSSGETKRVSQKPLFSPSTAWRSTKPASKSESKTKSLNSHAPNSASSGHSCGSQADHFPGSNSWTAAAE